MKYIIIFFGGLFIYSLIILLFGEKASRAEAIKKRINKSKKSKINDDEFFENVPFMERIVKPAIDFLVRGISDLLPKGAESDEDNEAQLVLLQAGIRMKVRDYSIFKFIIIVLFGILGGFYLSSIRRFGALSFVFGLVFGAIIGYLIMYYILKRRTRIRKENMERQFPEFLDLLCVCIESGLGFDQAVKYVITEYKSDLSDEFKIVLRDISLGSTRKQALLKLQQRCLVEQIKTFNAAIIQADEMGISLKKILNAQSYNARQTRKRKVEEEVQKLPVKILFPMLIFIFPIIFVVLLLPAGISIVQTLSGTGILQ